MLKPQRNGSSLPQGLAEGNSNASQLASTSNSRPGARVDNRHAEPPSLSPRENSNPAGQRNVASYSPELVGSPVAFATPGSSISDESMNNHGDNLTPPESPAQRYSPPGSANVDGMGRLSLEHNDPGHGPPTDHRGRDMKPAIASKRAASCELERPPGRRSPGDDVLPGPAAEVRPPTSALPPKRDHHARHLGSRGGKPGSQPRAHMTPVIVRSQQFQDDPSSARGKQNQQKIREDSGYATMQSRSNTGQQSDMGVPLKKGTIAPVYSSPVATDIHGQIAASAQPKHSRHPGLVLQPDSSPISQEQLAAEVKGIYAGLVMVEAKCINIDAAQANDLTSHLGPEQWQALIALHRTLLYEHHDFLMATQHPSSTPTLRGLAVKYSMPARMWKHGIHAFLEVLRHRRPESQDYMLAFIYLAYQMMALLYETVPAFLDTWIECLGDLARYRMAIEEEREAHAQWGGVASRWYTIAADRHPSVGRLNHHLGILVWALEASDLSRRSANLTQERPSLRKLCFYSKALTCSVPFPNARDSLATLCGPIVQDEQAVKTGSQSVEASVVTFHAMVFSGLDQALVKAMMNNAMRLLASLQTAKLCDVGAALAVVNVAGVLELGDSTNALWQAFANAQGKSPQELRPLTNPPDAQVADPELAVENPSATQSLFANTIRTVFCYQCFNRMIRSYEDPRELRDLLPFVHVMLVHFRSLQLLQGKKNNTGEDSNTAFPILDFGGCSVYWGGLSDFLNSLFRQQNRVDPRLVDMARGDKFPTPLPQRKNEEGWRKPLAEDHTLRGLIWTGKYFPDDWFPGHAIDEEGRAVEMPAMAGARIERVLWLGLWLAFHSDWLNFDVHRREFTAPLRGTPPPAVVASPPTTNRLIGAPSTELQANFSIRTPVVSRGNAAPPKSRQRPSGRSSATAKPAAKTWANVARYKPETFKPQGDNVEVVDQESEKWRLSA